MWELAVIILFTIALYWRTIYFKLIVDDIKMIEGSQKRDNRFRTIFNWRNPIMSLTDIVNKRFYGAGAFPFWRHCPLCKGRGKVLFGPNREEAKEQKCHVCEGKGMASNYDLRLEHGFSVFLHIIISCLIYLALGQNTISLLAALLYVANPTNTQTSVWLNGRRYAINIILTLSMMLIGPLGLALYFITPLFQINAIFTPVLLGSWWWVVVPIVVLINWNKFLAFYKERMKTIVNDDMNTWGWHRVIVAFKTYGFYMRQMIFPGRTMMLYPFLAMWGLTEKGNKEAYKISPLLFFGIFSFAASIAACFVLTGIDRYYMIFLVLSLVQWCNIITPTQTAADRYCNMTNVFVMYFISKFSFMFLGIYALPVLGFLLGFYIAQIFAAFPMFQNIKNFYDYHNFHDPENINARKFEVNWKMKMHDPFGAFELLKVGLHYNPEDFTFLYQAGVIMQMVGDYKKSEEYFDKADKNHYCNQRQVWEKNMTDLRNNNRLAIASYSKNNKPKGNGHPNGNGNKVIDFVRQKRK